MIVAVETMRPSEKQLKYFEFIAGGKKISDIHKLCQKVTKNRTNDYKKLSKLEMQKAISELLKWDRVKQIKQQMYNVLISLPQKNHVKNTSQRKGDIR